MTDREIAIDRLDRAMVAIKRMPDRFEPLSITLCGSVAEDAKAAEVHVYADFDLDNRDNALEAYATMAGLPCSSVVDADGWRRVHVQDENGTMLLQCVAPPKEVCRDDD
jgi:hypothetical protein